jgi:hypothetical protein
MQQQWHFFLLFFSGMDASLPTPTITPTNSQPSTAFELVSGRTRHSHFESADSILKSKHFVWWNEMPKLDRDFWAWYIDPLKEEKGWQPHRDRDTMSTTPDPQYCTVWIPLTDATLDNGCMFVLPARFDNEYHCTNTFVSFWFEFYENIILITVWISSSLHFKILSQPVIRRQFKFFYSPL